MVTIGTVLGLDTLAPDPIIVECTNRSGNVVLGGIVALDLTQADSATTTSDAGSSPDDAFGVPTGLSNSSLGNVVDPTTAQLEFGIFGVVVSFLTAGSANDDENVLVLFRGDVDPSTVTGNSFVGALTDGAVTVGQGLVPQDGSNALDAAVDTTTLNQKVIAIAKETDDANSRVECWFDGINGFGAIS